MSLTKFTSITGTCVPIPGPDMDTDRIIPARFLKCITFDELAGVMFWDERFDENGQSKSHPVDDPRFKGASIILGGSNFGCGSSREHAPQTIRRSGIKAVIEKSFSATAPESGCPAYARLPPTLPLCPGTSPITRKRK